MRQIDPDLWHIFATLRRTVQVDDTVAVLNQMSPYLVGNSASR